MTGEGATQFRVAPAIFARFPGLRLAVVVAHGVDNHTARPAVAEGWRAAWVEAARTAAGYGNAQSHPRVRPWREAFRAMGVSSKEFPSSIESMLRRALKGGAPFEINPLVDFYNGVSLRHVVPVGGFDLDELRGPLDLRLTRDGDRFTALGEETALAAPPGEVAYADGPTILTRHFVWRQARTGLIIPPTRSVFLVSEVLGDVGGDVAEAVLDDLRTGLRAHFDVTPRAFLLDEQHADGSEK
jgi:DNA/RNA-binding domain of Phe-tRNA-synthetase-like protein